MDNRSDLIQSASAAIEANDPDRALALAREILQGDPENADGYLILGIAHAMQGNDADAISALRNAVYCAPDSARARYNLATHLYRVGKKDEAAEQISAALTADPTHAASLQLRRLLETESVTIESTEVAQIPPIVGQEPPRFGVEQKRVDRPPTWIDGVGVMWPIAGWFFTICSLAVFVISMIVAYPIAMKAAPAEMLDPKYLEAIAKAMPGWLQTFDLVSRTFWFLWMLTDLFTRRRSPWWLLGFIPCCCLNGGWLLGVVYLLTGKLEKR